MNNQFFGDVRDFYKYALLRILSNHGKCSIAACWLLTTGNREGKRQSDYLYKNDDKNSYKQKDEELFYFLQKHICDKENPGVSVMNDKIIPGAKFFADEFPLEKGDRGKYWKEFIKAHDKNKLLFFDADTGIMPKSGASKKNEENEYICIDEIKYLWLNCKESSLMIFQYFNPCSSRKYRQERHREIIAQLGNIGEQVNIFCLYKHPVAYYFMLREGHDEIYERVEFEVTKLGFEKHD